MPPVITPTPCNPDEDEECPPPPPPPDDVPEPATFLILIVGVLGVWLAFHRRPHALASNNNARLA
ncbi:MAG: PEP-CTERM sorting domain-containing protein [Pseudomonadota bacterium]